MKKSLLLALTMVLFMVSGAFAEERPIKIAIEGVYPPFNFVDPQGNAKGFEVDLAKALCKEMHRSCDFVVLDWDGMIPGLLARKVDAIAASMSITEERKKSVAFTQKYYEENGSFVTKKGSGLEITSAGLKGKRIGVQRSTTWSSYLENTYPDVKIIYYDEDNRGCLDLVAGRIDAYLAQSYYMSQWLKKPEAKAFEIVGGPVSDRTYIGEGIGIALRKEDASLKNQFDNALETVLANGTYQQIASSYFDFNIYGAMP